MCCGQWFVGGMIHTVGGDFVVDYGDEDRDRDRDGCAVDGKMAIYTRGIQTEAL